MCPCLLHFVDDGLNLVSAVLWWAVAGTGCTILAKKKLLDNDNNLDLTLIHWPSWRAGLSLSKVHDFLGVGMDQNSSGHGRGGSVLAASWQVASLSTVMLLLDKVIPKQSSLSILSISHVSSWLPRSEGYKMRVVGGGGYGDWACAPDIGVAQLICQLLQLISIKMIIIP